MPTNLFAPEQRLRLTLKPGKERALRNRHPWIFSGSIGEQKGPAEAPVADLVDREGRVLASGLHSSHSQIRLRALTFDGEAFDESVLRQRIVRALAARRGLLAGNTTAVRLVNSEGDDLSGLVVDRYGEVLVVEIANSGLEQFKPLIVDVLQELERPRLLHFRNDLPARKIERLSLEFDQVGEGSPTTVILENGLSFEVDPAEGQKTGFFLDQRQNRAIVKEHSRGESVLNLFSYSGAFGVYAMAGGAEAVENVDISQPAIELARRNHALNAQHEQVRFRVADVFQYLRALAAGSSRFGVIVCDPPAFAKSRGEVERAARGYKDVNLYALRLLRSGGLLATFSCSGHMSLDLFQKVIFSAALDAGRRVSFLSRLEAGPDHPVSLFCPEGEYLKGFLLRAE